MTRLAEALSDPVLSFEVGDKIGILTKESTATESRCLSEY